MDLFVFPFLAQNVCPRAQQPAGFEVPNGELQAEKHL
jgi:hypothetical protein